MLLHAFPSVTHYIMKGQQAFGEVTHASLLEEALCFVVFHRHTLCAGLWISVGAVILPLIELEVWRDTRVLSPSGWY